MGLRDFYFNRIDFRDKTVLDAGTGEGVLLPRLLEKQPLKIYAVDIDSSVLLTAKSSVPNLAHNVISFVEADISDMDFLKTSSVDIAIANYSIGRARIGLPDTVDYLKEINRVLRPSGLLAILDDCPDSFAKYDNRLVSYLQAVDAISIFLGEELWRDHSKEWMERRVLEVGFVIEDSILHEDECIESGKWLKRNIKWQIDNAKTIKEEFIGESLIKLLNKIDKNTLATDSFLAGSQYSILARKR